MKPPTGKQQAKLAKAARRLKRAIQASQLARSPQDVEKAAAEGVAASLAYGRLTARLP